MSDGATAAGTCTLERCQVAEDGHCFEALADPTECPNFRAAARGEETTGVEEETLADDGSPAEETVPWRSGKALEPAEANDLLAEAGGEVIVIAGEAESGKTTLLTVLFALLRAGRLASYSYRESATLLGFERRGFLASTASFGEVADTERTHNLGDEGELLHLLLRSQEGGDDRQIQVLLTDIPGEKFRRVRNNTASAADVPLLARADKLVILADGERLAGPEHQAAAAEGRQLLGAILASGMLPVRTRLALALTKYDWMASGVEAGDAASTFWREELKILRQIAARADYELSLFETAARAERSASIQPGHGIDELAAWMIEPIEVAAIPARRPLLDAARQFDLP